MKKLALLTVFLVITAHAARGQTATTLSPQQIEALKALKASVEQRSVPYATQMAETIKRIYANMLAPKEDQKLRKKLARDLHFYAAKLLDIRGQSYRDALVILTPEQRNTIRDALQKPDAPKDIGELIEKTFGLAK